MGVVKFGSTVVGIRGTVGGLTFSENKNSAYVKTWTRGANPRSAGQTTQRGRLVNVSVAWQSLTSGQRADWDVYAAAPNEDDYNPWGEIRFLSGFQWYIRAGARRLQVGQAISATTPSGAAATPPAGCSLSVFEPGAGNSQLSYTNGTFSSTDSLILECALSQRQGKQAVTSGYRQIIAEYNPGNGPKTINSALSNAFGDLVAGWVIHGRVYKQAQYGNRSTVVTVTATVSA